MPYSSDEGKEFIKEAVSSLSDISRVLDVGPGAGTYFNLLRNTIPNATWTAIEAWEPYISKFALANKYSSILLEDARNIDWSSIGNYDMTIFGDVLEHMTRDDAERLLSYAAKISRYVIISVPIIHYPQDALEGNPYEVHQYHWSPELIRNELLSNYDVETFAEFNVVGVYIIRGDINHE